jgi:hypothetical protein
MTDTRQLRTLEMQNSLETAVIWPEGPTTGAATGVDMVNNTKTAKWVRVSGGTFSAVKTGLPGATVQVGGAVSAADGEWVRVRPGHALNIVHTGAPTLQWFEE